MALTPEDVIGKTFLPTRFQEGYNQDEVDDFLDEVVATLRGLQQENDELRSKLTSCESRCAELSAEAQAPRSNVIDLDKAAPAVPAPAPVAPAPAVAAVPPMPAMGEDASSSAAGVLALAQQERSPLLPNIPTFAEQGLPQVDAPLWNGIVAPAGTPADVVDRLNRAINGVLAEPATREKLAGGGMEVLGGPPERFARMMRTESTKWVPVIQRLGIRPD